MLKRCSDEDEVSSSHQSVLPTKRRKRQAKNSIPIDILMYKPDTSEDERRRVPEEVMRCRNVDSMVRMACINLRNFNNLPLLEWSEAIMLQLCMLKIELDFKQIDWSTVRSILKSQWSHEVVSSLRKHCGCLDTLNEIITKNHAEKLRRKLVENDEMFYIVPHINYQLLQTFCTEPINVNQIGSSMMNIKTSK